MRRSAHASAAHEGLALGQQRAAALAPPHTDWLRHDLIVTGPALDVAALRRAAAGAGVIPWVYPDLDHWEEDRMHKLVQPPDGSAGLSPAAARVLARQLRSAVEAHHQRVLAVARRTPCPFDLHAIVPVPSDILRCGPDDPVSHAWLQTSWGTTLALRHVRLHTDQAARRQSRSARMHVTFWAADWTPWPVFAVLREHYSALKFDVRPDYGDV
jgi:hypothetical protein